MSAAWNRQVGNRADDEAIIEVMKHTSDARIIVFGDYALDKYLYSDPANDEISAETGDMAFRIHRKRIMAGVGGTITNNLRALGAQVRCIGLIGEDGEGMELCRALEETGADTSHMVRTDELCTCTYQKLLRKQDDGFYREYRRLDFRNFTEPSQKLQGKMMEELEEGLSWADAVIITDQFYQRNMGAVTDKIREEVSELALRRKDRIFYADSRAFADGYHHMIVKCNNLELYSLLKQEDTESGISVRTVSGQTDMKNTDTSGNGAAGDTDSERSWETELSDLIKEGSRIQKQQDTELIVTCGSRGMVVFQPDPQLVGAFHVEGPLDIVGAGDASNAGIVLGLTLGLNRRQAARLACCVSSITIQQLNTTGTASLEQVTERLKGLG